MPLAFAPKAVTSTQTNLNCDTQCLDGEGLSDFFQDDEQLNAIMDL